MITQTYVRSVFSYDPHSGHLTYIKKVAQSVNVGQRAGCVHKASNYRVVSIKNRRYKEHRVIWLYVYGYLPEHDIDHKDGDKTNNCLANLREASRSCNNYNSKLWKTNSTGFRGVGYDKRRKKYTAAIVVNYKNKSLGYHSTYEDAVCARIAGEQCLGFTYTNQQPSRRTKCQIIPH